MTVRRPGLVLVAALAGCMAGCAQTDPTIAASSQDAATMPADVADAAARPTGPLLRTAAAVEPIPANAATRGSAAAGPRLVLTPLTIDQWSRTAIIERPRDAAPMPNRGLDPPFSLPPSDPSFSPMLMRPGGGGPDPSAALGPGHPLSRDDRQFQQPAAGARLSLPFTN